MYVAHGMVKQHEIKEILNSSRFHISLMSYTAFMVPVVGFMWAVVSAIIIYASLNPWFGNKKRSGITDTSLHHEEKAKLEMENKQA
jgi:hypothetical protein